MILERVDELMLMRFSGFANSGVRVRQETNVIIRNLNFNLAPEGADQIDIDESTYVWVDHCAFANAGITGDKDYYDGLLDAKHGADFLTFSWNVFADHVSKRLENVGTALTHSSGRAP